MPDNPPQAPRSIMQMRPYEVEVMICGQLVKRYKRWQKQGDELNLRIWKAHYDKCLVTLEREGVIKPKKGK